MPGPSEPLSQLRVDTRVVRAHTHTHTHTHIHNVIFPHC